MGIAAGPYIAPQRDVYFSLWRMTEFGAQHPQSVRSTIEKASAMIRSTNGAECHLFIPVGGPWDYIGLAWGTDDERIVQIQHAIRAAGTFETTFVKAREFSLPEFVAFSQGVMGFMEVGG
jgi:uncharacterized protein with GYD domain